MEVEKMNKKALSLLSLGHMVTDISQGALPVLLPFIKEALQISYTKSGLILLFANFTSSIIQPAFGHLADRYSQGWFLPGGIFLASIALSLTGFAWSYEVLLLLVVLSGMGVAIFHPEGYRTAHFFTGQKKATGMAIFSVGGNLGFSLGPIMVTYLVTYCGLKGTGFFSIPGVVTVFLFIFSLIQVRTKPCDRSAVTWPVVPHGTTFQNVDLGVPVRGWVDDDLVATDVAQYPDVRLGDPIGIKATAPPPLELDRVMKSPFQVLVVGDDLLDRVVGAVVPFVAIDARRGHLAHLALVEHPPLLVHESHGVGIPRGLHPPLSQEALGHAEEAGGEEA